MATTYNDNGGNTPNGSHLNFTYTFPVIKNADVKVALNGITQATTKYTVNSGVNPTRIEFNNTSIDSTLQESTGAPKTGVVVRVYRDTGLEDPADRRVTFQAGSAIRAQDLNNVYEHLLYSTQEEQNQLERITDADVIPTAEIQVSKLKDGTARQVLQTDSAGTGVEWTSNVDVPGTLDVTSTAAFDSNVSIAGTTTAAAINASGAVGVDGNFDVNTNKFTVAASSGNTIIGGDLDVQGNFEVTGTSLHTGQQTVPGGAQVKNIKVGLDAPNEVSTTSGNLVLDSASGTVQITDHFNVTGNADVDTNLNVDGTLTVDGTSTLTGNTSIGGTLTVTGTTNLAAGSIGTAELADDAVTAAKIADDVVNSEHYAAGSIDTEHIADSQITTAKIADGALTSAKYANNSVTADKGADNNVQTRHITDANVTTAKIADANVTTAKIADGAVTSAKLGDNSVSTAKIADDAVTLAKIADAAIVTNSEQATATANDTTFFTTSASDARYFNISSGDTIKDGQTFPDNDTTIATTAAINDRIIDLVDDVGGFVPIANETSFPTTNPDVNNGSGTLVSIKALANNLVSNGSGVATIANAAGTGNTVTINGLANSTTYLASFGMIVETTSTLHTYAFHRYTAKATEVSTVAGSITNVNTVAGSISNVNTVASNISNVNAVAADASDIGAVAGKATEIGRLGTADAVADLALLGTADVVSDLNTLGTSDIVSDMNTLAVSGVISDMDTCATNVSNINTVGGAISNVNTTAGSIGNVNTVASNISDVNNFADLYQIASSNPSTDGGGNSLAEGDLYFNTSADELKVWNGSAWQGGVTATGNFATVTGNTFTGDNKYNDGVKILSGTGSDLEIYHDATNNQIKSVNGKVVITTTAGNADIEVTPHGSGVVKLDGLSWPTADGSASQYLKTNGSGVLSWGTVSVGGATGTDYNDSVAVRWGTHNDLKIYHDGTNSIIKDRGTGGLELQSDGTGIFLQKEESEYLAKFLTDGAVELYFDHSKKLETSSSGVEIVNGDLRCALDLKILNDDRKVIFGAGEDFKIYHEGSGSYINHNGAGDLWIQAQGADENLWLRAKDDIYIQTNDNENSAKFIKNGGVELYYDNSKKIETTSSGAAVTGTLTAGNIDSTGSITVDDSEKFVAGTGSDFQIYHNGSSANYIDSVNKDLYLRCNLDAGITGGDIILQPKSGENSAIFRDNGAVELYYNDSKVFETTSTGVTVSSTNPFLEISGSASSSGDTGIFLNANANHWIVKADNYTSGNQFQIKHGDTSSSETAIACVQNGAVNLYYDNVKKLETIANGTNIVGNLGVNRSGANRTIDVESASNANVIYINSIGTPSNYYMKFADDGTDFFEWDANKNMNLLSDSAKIQVGASQDLKIYHDGSNSYIDNAVTGDLFVRSTQANGDVNIVCSASNGGFIVKSTTPETMINATANGAVDLYYDNSKKFETYSSGVKVSGAVTFNDITQSVLWPEGSNTSSRAWAFLGDQGGNGTFHLKCGNADGDSPNDNVIKAVANGVVELYCDNVKTFQTETNGIRAIGPEGGDAVLKLYADEGDDNADLWKFTASAADGDLYISNHSSGSWESSIVCKDQNSVELYYDNVKKFNTDSAGVEVRDNDSTVEISLIDSNGTAGHIYGDDSNGHFGLLQGNGEWAIKTIQNSAVQLFYDNSEKFSTESDGVSVTGHVKPGANDTYDLGSSGAAWNNLYVNDLHFSNNPDNPNSVDGTWGDWTLQEGENDIFMLNNRSGKKYKMNLTEVS